MREFTGFGARTVAMTELPALESICSSGPDRLLGYYKRAVSIPRVFAASIPDLPCNGQIGIADPYDGDGRHKGPFSRHSRVYLDSLGFGGIT